VNGAEQVLAASSVDSGVLANVLGGVLALLLLIYLFVALIRPEKF
jgi:K+-transporting ATPase KdpF subunit